MHQTGEDSAGRRQLEGEAGRDIPDLTYWGDTLSGSNKQADSIRIGFVNIRSLGTFADHYKNKQLSTFIEDYDFDTFGTAENNVNWRACKVEDCPLD